MKLATLVPLALLALAGAAAAQPVPAAIPDGFVLPGPPPTGAAPATTAPSPSTAAPPTGGRAHADPDWPCIQRKVPSLDAAAIWTGPAVAADSDWRADAAVASLVERLVQRRLPLADAEAEVEAFAAGLAPEERARVLPLLFAGLFETMDAERSEIMAGIERYARRQKAMADDIRGRMAALDARRADPAGDPEAVAAAQRDLEWEVRIFNDRRASLSTICEFPRVVEQRLFALGRTITAQTR